MWLFVYCMGSILDLVNVLSASFVIKVPVLKKSLSVRVYNERKMPCKLKQQYFLPR